MRGLTGLPRAGLLLGTVVAIGWGAVWPSASQAIPLVSPERGQPSSKNKALVEGLRALTQQNTKAAEQAFEEAIKQDAQQYEAYLGLAQIAMNDNRADAARKHLEKARSVQPKHVDVETAWGRFYVYKREYKDAVAAFKRAIQVDDSAVTPRLDLGDLYLTALKNPKAAAEVYGQVIAMQPTHAGAYYGLGIAMADTGVMEKAKEAWKESSRLAPSNPSSAFALARLYLMEKQYDAALTEFGVALKADPLFARAYIGRGDAWVGKNNDEKALAEYRKAVELEPRSIEAHERIGMFHQQRKQWNEAERAYLTAIDIKPNAPLAYNNLAWVVLEQKGGEEKALQFATKAAELMPQSAQFQDTLGWAYRATGNIPKAIAALQRASAIAPRNPEILYHLGAVLSQAGQRKDAATALRKSLEMEADFPGLEDARAQLAVLEK